MPQVEIVIGGRSFEVACQPGEETFLRAAAEILDVEASALSSQIGRMPEARMLLMAGLMLADKASGLEEQLRAAEARIHALETRAAAPPREIEVPVEVPVEVRVEVPVVPDEVTGIMADLAAEAEALARAVLAVIPDKAQREPA
jgi:cell division protein ZapA